MRLASSLPGSTSASPMAKSLQSMVNVAGRNAGVPVHQRGSITPGSGLVRSAAVFVAKFVAVFIAEFVLDVTMALREELTIRN